MDIYTRHRNTRLQVISRIMAFLVVGFGQLACQGQQRYSIWVDGQLHDALKDSLEWQKKSSAIIGDWQNQGYLFAGRDSVSGRNAYLHKGEKIALAGNAQFYEIRKTADHALREKWNNGFPFAQLQWDSAQWSGERLDLRYQIKEGPYVVYDSIVLLNNANLKQTYLERVFDISKGDPYSEKNFARLTKKARRLKYFDLKAPPDVAFQSGKAWTYFDFEQQTTNTFQGIVGVLPNQAGDGKTLLTGDLQLRLGNMFRSGKELEIDWQRFGEASQKTRISYFHPFILGTRVNAGFELSLTRQDSSFVNRELGIRANTYIADDLLVGFEYENTNSNVLSDDSVLVLNNGWLNFDQHWYTVTIGLNRVIRQSFDNFMAFNTKLSLGTRRIRPGPVFSDTLKTHSGNFRIMSTGQWQQTLGRRQAVYTRALVAHLSGDTSPNQRFRLGGFRSLRGFNEQFFFTQSHIVVQWEWRLFFEKSSYLLAFTDQGALWSPDYQWAMGFGVGITLETQAGLFNFALAAGRTKQIPLDLSDMKVHFGYLSRF